jgi:hypothetical protein
MTTSPDKLATLSASGVVDCKIELIRKQCFIGQQQARSAIAQIENRARQGIRDDVRADASCFEGELALVFSDRRHGS